MKRLSHLLLLALLLIANPYDIQASWADSGAPAFTSSSLTIQTKGGKAYLINIELALTPEQQEYGLMNRTSLKRNRGMLFLYPSERDIRMWMKDTLIPLDMLFMDERGKIVYIVQNAQPNSLDVIDAGRPARAVLELMGGTVESYRIRKGDRIIYSAFYP